MPDHPIPTAVLPDFSDSPLRSYASLLCNNHGSIEARYKDRILRSAFQPIFSFAHARPVGFEGLVRASDPEGNVVSPLTLLSEERAMEGTIFLDRLLRTLHIANFVHRSFEDSWLFLNVSPSVVINGRTQGPFFRQMLEAWNVPPQQVVVEVTEDKTSDEGVLEEAASYYKRIGCLVAIDDFGAGYSNFQRIWRLRPDIVKLDRMLVSHATRDSAARRGLVGLAGLLHEAGALVLAEGVETEEEALAVLHADVDLLQGYHFQRPFIGPPPCLNQRERFDTLRRSLMKQAKEEEAEFNTAFRKYFDSFARAAERLAAGEPFSAAVGSFLDLRNVIRAYLLDSDGAQIGDNLTATDQAAVRNPRHEPLIKATGANWMHRHYFRRAMSNPETIQISRPYLSLTDPQMCLTLSRVVRTTAGQVVLCCDLNYPVS